jgi:hypothetical protein
MTIVIFAVMRPRSRMTAKNFVATFATTIMPPPTGSALKFAADIATWIATAQMCATIAVSCAMTVGTGIEKLAQRGTPQKNK